MIKRNTGVIAYIFLTFGLAWAAWGLVLAQNPRPDNVFAFLVAVLPGVFAPALAALIVRQWVTREGFADLQIRLQIRRWPVFLLAWFLPLIVVAVVVLLAYSFNLSLPDYTLQRGFVNLTGASPPQGLRFMPLVVLVALIAPGVAPLMLGEELGWRGYLQPRLFPNRPFMAALTTGAIWSIWHLPLLWFGYPLSAAAPTLVTIPLLMIYFILLSVLFGWLQHRTGSVWAPALGHASVKVIGVNLAAVLFAGGPNYIWLSFGGILSLIPLSLVCLYIVMSMQGKSKRREDWQVTSP